MEGQKISNNILTYLRIRGPLGEEVKYPQIVQPIGREDVDVNGQKYHFCHVLPQSTTQPQVFDIVGQPFIKDILQGYNGTIFVYGLSGTGKSYTMTGYSDIIDNITDSTAILWKDPKDMGLVPRIVQALFKEIYKQEDFEFSLQVSYLEIYMEKIRDLLNPKGVDLQIRESSYKGIWVEDATQLYVTSFDDLIKIMRKGEINRTVAATLLNSHSSRSHSLFTIKLSKTDIKTGARIRSKMTFIDLAGSEKVEKSGATGLILKQAQYNNKSLLTLGLVIRDLAEKKPHIRYRDSKLTRILSESLGGNSRTALIATCSPSQIHLEETLSTMRFASLTGQIKNTPKINSEITPEEYRRQLYEANNKIATQQLVIESLEKDIKALMKLCEDNGIDVKEMKKMYSLSLKKKVNGAREEDISQEEEIERLQKLTEELREKAGMVGELQELIERLNTSLRHSQEEKQVLNDKILHTSSALDTLEEMKKTYDEERQLYEDKVTRLQHDLEDEKKRYDLLYHVVEEAEERYRKKEKESLDEISIVRDKLKDTLLKVSLLEGRLSQEEKLRREHELLKESSLRELTKVKEELDTLRQVKTSEWSPHVLSSGDKEERPDDIHESYKRVTEELEGKSSHIQVLERQLEDVKGQLRQVISENKALKKTSS